MMLIITPRAEMDLEQISRYIARESGSGLVAYEFAEKLRQKCEHLASLPFKIGTPRDDLRKGLRSYAFGNYALYYQFTAEAMEVVAILESHRDVDALFE